jgi:hypothetical protein
MSRKIGKSRKGSDRNKLIALAFSKMVVENDEAPTAEYICCTGPYSIFELFAHCLPTCARHGKNTTASNRDGVSGIELNKLLAESGYVCYRKRELVPGTSNVWTRGRRRWKHRRWVNLEGGDLGHLVGHLAAMHEEFVETRDLSTERISQAMSALAARRLVLDAPPELDSREDMFKISTGYERVDTEVEADMVMVRNFRRGCGRSCIVGGQDNCQVGH